MKAQFRRSRFAEFASVRSRSHSARTPRPSPSGCSRRPRRFRRRRARVELACKLATRSARRSVGTASGKVFARAGDFASAVKKGDVAGRARRCGVPGGRGRRLHRDRGRRRAAAIRVIAGSSSRAGPRRSATSRASACSCRRSAGARPSFVLNVLLGGEVEKDVLRQDRAGARYGVARSRRSASARRMRRWCRRASSCRAAWRRCSRCRAVPGPVLVAYGSVSAAQRSAIAGAVASFKGDATVAGLQRGGGGGGAGGRAAVHRAREARAARGAGGRGCSSVISSRAARSRSSARRPRRSRRSRDRERRSVGSARELRDDLSGPRRAPPARDRGGAGGAQATRRSSLCSGTAAVEEPLRRSVVAAVADAGVHALVPARRGRRVHRSCAPGASRRWCARSPTTSGRPRRRRRAITSGTQFDVVTVGPGHAGDVLPGGKVAVITRDPGQAPPGEVNPAALIAALDAIAHEEDRVRDRVPRRGDAPRGARAQRDRGAVPTPAPVASSSIHLAYLEASRAGRSGRAVQEHRRARRAHARCSTTSRTSARRSAATRRCSSTPARAATATAATSRGPTSRGASAAKRFADLLARMEKLQQEVCRRIKPGMPYEDLHDDTHRLLADVAARDSASARAAPASSSIAASRARSFRTASATRSASSRPRRRHEAAAAARPTTSSCATRRRSRSARCSRSSPACTSSTACSSRCAQTTGERLRRLEARRRAAAVRRDPDRGQRARCRSAASAT